MWNLWKPLTGQEPISMLEGRELGDNIKLLQSVTAVQSRFQESALQLPANLRSLSAPLESSHITSDMTALEVHRQVHSPLPPNATQGCQPTPARLQYLLRTPLYLHSLTVSSTSEIMLLFQGCEITCSAVGSGYGTCISPTSAHGSGMEMLTAV